MNKKAYLCIDILYPKTLIAKPFQSGDCDGFFRFFFSGKKDEI